MALETTALDHAGASPAQSVCARVHPRAGALCGGCRAYEIGRNCWEMPVTPCCDQPRGACAACAVHVDAMREAAQTDRVRITLEGGMVVEGEITLPPGQRTSDVLNDASRAFITIANAALHPPGSPAAPPERRDVLLIAKRAAVMVIPASGGAA
jgi:hypothetical protein